MCAEDDEQPLKIESIDRRSFVKSWGTAAEWLGFQHSLNLSKSSRHQTCGPSDYCPTEYKVSLRLGEEDVLLVRDAQNKVRAFNPTCTHKKYRVRFNPMKERLDCKCHKSSFNLEGEVQGGPAPRDQTFATRIDETKQQLRSSCHPGRQSDKTSGFAYVSSMMMQLAQLVNLPLP